MRCNTFYGSHDSYNIRYWRSNLATTNNDSDSRYAELEFYYCYYYVRSLFGDYEKNYREVYNCKTSI